MSSNLCNSQKKQNLCLIHIGTTMPSSTSLFDNGRIRKRRVRRKEVLRLLAAIMEQSSSTTTDTTSTNADAHQNDFYNTGRVGRRNALPDILNSHCTTSTADLPDKLSALTTNDPLEANTSAQSGSNADHASASTTDLMNNT